MCAIHGRYLVGSADEVRLGEGQVHYVVYHIAALRGCTGMAVLLGDDVRPGSRMRTLAVKRTLHMLCGWRLLRIVTRYSMKCDIAGWLR